MLSELPSIAVRGRYSVTEAAKVMGVDKKHHPQVDRGRNDALWLPPPQQAQVRDWRGDTTIL